MSVWSKCGKKRKVEIRKAHTGAIPPGYGIGARLCPYFSGRSRSPRIGKKKTQKKSKLRQKEKNNGKSQESISKKNVCVFSHRLLCKFNVTDYERNSLKTKTRERTPCLDKRRFFLELHSLSYSRKNHFEKDRMSIHHSFPTSKTCWRKECLRRRVSFHKVSAFKIGQLCIRNRNIFSSCDVVKLSTIFNRNRPGY